MFRMSGQVFGSRQNLSTYIHVGNAAVPWPLLDIHAFAVLMHPCMSMAKNSECSWGFILIFT
jgi:hypothetical protein